MGKLNVNGKGFVTPKDEMSVNDIKELAGIPRNSRLYDKSGTVLDDAAVVPTENAELGVVTSWERG